MVDLHSDGATLTVNNFSNNSLTNNNTTTGVGLRLRTTTNGVLTLTSVFNNAISATGDRGFEVNENTGTLTVNVNAGSSCLGAANFNAGVLQVGTPVINPCA